MLDRRIDLPSVQGRIDHMAIDVDGSRLFVAALGANSLEVVDLRAGKRSRRITSLHEPQGVLYLAGLKRVLVANAAGGGVQAFVDDQQVAASGVPMDDADNLRLDPSSDRVYVGFGNALAALDPRSLDVLQRVALSGHPESFQIERSGTRIYVNVPTAGHIAVVDRESGKVLANWPLGDSARNFPMALDEDAHRLFVATRRPARLLVYDTLTGRQISQTPTCGDADDLFADATRRRVYVVCGEGSVDVLQPRDAMAYAVTERVPTAPGARTGLFVASTSTLYVAAPARGGATAGVLVYRAR